MQNRNGYLYVNDGVLVSPIPTYRARYEDFVNTIRPFYPRAVRYLESGKSFSSAIVILTDDTGVEQLPAGIFIPRPRFGVLKNYGFRDPNTGEIYPDHVLEAFAHRWFVGFTLRDYEYTPNYIKERAGQMPQIALALAAVNPRDDGTREVRIRGFGSERQMNELLAELERIPLAVRTVDVLPPTLGKEGLGNDELYKVSI